MQPPISTVIWETFEVENLREFRDFTATRESFLHELLGMLHPLCDQFNIPWKFSPWNAPLLPIRKSFLPWKFPAIQLLYYAACLLFYWTFTIQKDGITALAGAAYKGHKQVVDVLLKAGANPDIQDKVTINCNMIVTISVSLIWEILVTNTVA